MNVNTKGIKLRYATWTASFVYVLSVVAACPSLTAEEHQGIRNLPQDVLAVFEAHDIKPVAVVVLLEGEASQVYQVPGYEITSDATISVSDLRLPELTIQESGSHVICNRHGCWRVNH